jgi:DNA-binding CsgD family transcriptional regulator
VRSYATWVRLTWPLTGRLEEIRLVEAAISAADLAGIVVCGSAGVGKSRVAREALSQVAGCDVRWAVATSSARALPLGTFASWAATEVADTLQLVRSVMESLTSASPGVTVVVAVDDVHLLDDLSTFVLHQIVQRGAAKVLLTVRSGETIPAGVQELWKGGQFDRLDLQPLSQDETNALLSATLGGSLDPDAARRLWQLTRGNVLYLRNIVEQEVTDGRLAQLHGFWRWTGDPIVPPSLVEMIESRIGALPTTVGDVIDALAVGEPLELAALTRITDPDAVEQADTHGLIALDRVGGGVEVRVAHPLYGEVRRRRAPSTKLRRLRGLIARELGESDQHDDMHVVVRRAALSLDSDLEPDPDLLIGAAQRAMWLADLPLVERLAAAAIRAGAGPEAYFTRAHALSWLDRGQEADSLLADLSTTHLSEAERARLAYLRANNMLFALANPQEAKNLIDVASRTTPPHARGCIDAFLTVYWLVMDKPEAALQASTDLAVDHLPAVAGTSTAWAITSILADAGRTTEALAAADAGYAAAARSFDTPHTTFNIADARISALALSGRVREAGEVAEGARQQAADLPGIAHSFGTALAGRAALGAGQLRTACSLLDQAVDALCAAGHGFGWGYRYRLPHTIALAMSGSCDEAAAALVSAFEAQRPWRLWDSGRLWDNERSLARAWVAACQGAVSEAIRILLSAAETARTNGQFAAEVMCLQTATQFGDESCGPRLRELEAVVEGPRAGLAARFAEALSDGDGTELHAVSEDFERMGDLVAAVDAAAHAALAHRRDDRKGSALTCSARADELAGRCGGASTPALRQASMQLPLSDREREIAMLIGQGLSSRAIADRLTLSVRTVEGHIYRAMAKTGATTREELAAMLPRQTSST